MGGLKYKKKLASIWSNFDMSYQYLLGITGRQYLDIRIMEKSHQIRMCEVILNRADSTGNQIFNDSF